jgi:hypothetical protein
MARFMQIGYRPFQVGQEALDFVFILPEVFVFSAYGYPFLFAAIHSAVTFVHRLKILHPAGSIWTLPSSQQTRRPWNFVHQFLNGNLVPKGHVKGPEALSGRNGWRLAVAISLASLFSSMAASAQMVTPMQNQMNMAMQHKQNYPSKGRDTGMFSVMGMSAAKNVTITGVSVTGDNEVTVNVRYTGNETATPGIGVFVMTNSMGMMHYMMMGHMEVMYGKNYGMDAGNDMRTRSGTMAQ